MKTKQRTLAVLLALVLVLGGLLWWLNRSNAQEEEAASAAAEGNISLSAFAAESVEQITYTFNGQTLTLDHTDDGWTLAEDPEYHLDVSACNTMVTALAALNAKRQFTPQPGEDYGLEEPTVTVTVTAAGEMNTFAFGAENPVTGDLYVQKNGEDTLYTIASNKAACFELTKEELFGAFNPAGITASALEEFTITQADGQTIVLTAASEQVQDASSDSADSSSAQYQTVWQLAADPEAELDSTKVQSVLNALSSYVSAQITAADPAAYGFTAPLATVQAKTADGTVTLRYASNTDGCWLMVEGDTSVYAVDLDTLNALLLTADDLKTE